MALKFAWRERTPSCKSWDDDPRYDDRWGRGLLVDDVKAKAEVCGYRLRSETPEPSWVRAYGDGHAPCREFTDGAIPAWIWWAE